MSVQSGESYRFEQEVYFDSFLFGSVNGYPFGGEAQIVRGVDGFYWDGSTFVVTETWVDTTVDASGLFHYYDWTVPVGSPNGSTFILRIRVKNDPVTETVGNMTVRPASSGGGGGSNAIKVFDGVDFATGFPSTVGFL